MEKNYTELPPFRPVAFARTDYEGKFGIPRQSGLAPSALCSVEFVPPHDDVNALRGLEGFSRAWLIWVFSENIGHSAGPTVRPPRMGGNARLGVFATRSPFRPNPIGLSCVEIVSVAPEGKAVLIVSGADLADGTPILDIKPYVPYADAFPDASPGFAGSAPRRTLEVRLPSHIGTCLNEKQIEALKESLSLDPRPAYHETDGRVYGMTYAGHTVKFSVEGDVLTVTGITSERQA
ncbi:MAG: tRNA (N6-threonylcarbamoyladenosine(37)-N6)-methyltransferase TrmO [Mailhella sp.]|nr:tRNA (N6-threonylcarbamoyladenosine(37)-N6)-methyltransferase TrmO [Mailhella sp.]